jgi:protein-tyrosine phosphatase
MIDLHCHILPGVDDGPATMPEALAMCRAAFDDGTRTIVATPHVSWNHTHVDAELVARVVADVNRELLAQRIDIEIRPGAEVAMTRGGELDDTELRGLRLGGGPYLLVECPFSPSATGFETILRQLLGRGHRIVLAHPERSPALRRDLKLVRELAGAGILCSVTAGSFTGHFGRTVRAISHTLLDEGLVHVISSDGHDIERRPPTIAGELAADGFSDDQIDHFARAVPLAVLNGAPIPAAPPAPPRRRRRFGILG